MHRFPLGIKKMDFLLIILLSKLLFFSWEPLKGPFFKVYIEVYMLFIISTYCIKYINLTYILRYVFVKLQHFLNLNYIFGETLTGSKYNRIHRFYIHIQFICLCVL